MQCEPRLAIFATANWISPIPNDIQKKFSTREFLSGTIERIKSAIGPASVATGSFSSNSLSPKWDKKSKTKTKEPSAQFYDQLHETTDSNTKEMDTKTDTPNILPADSDEFKQTVENYEKAIERRSTNTVQTQTQALSGILKKSKDKTKTSSALDIDIVVIDKSDIHESTRHEGDVIVVDNTLQDVDLADLLGSDWPKTAGDTAAILNNKQNLQNSTLTRQSIAVAGVGGNGSTNTGTQKHNRNKSSNPLSHLGGGSSGSNTKKVNDCNIGGSNKNVDRKIQSEYTHTYLHTAYRNKRNTYLY